MDNNQQQEDRLLRVSDVAKALAVSVRTVWRLSHSGALPEPLRVGRSARWRASDIQEAIDHGFTSSRAGSGAPGTPRRDMSNARQ
jgi:excisionase family DNA binding protein